MKIYILIFTFLFLLFGCNSNDVEQDGDDSQEITLPDKLDFKSRLINCGDFSVHQFLNLENRNISLNIRGSGKDNLNLSSELKSFQLPDDDITFNITIYETPSGSLYCEDAPFRENILISKWIPISGEFGFSVSDSEKTEFGTFYRISLLLENAVFVKSGSDKTRTISSLSIDSNLGSVPG